MNFVDKSSNKLIMNKLLFIAFFAVVIAGCDDFGSMNVDPNNAQEAQPDLLLTYAERSVGAYVGSVNGALYVQYFAETQYTDASTYSSVNFSFASGYTPVTNPPDEDINAYSGPLHNLQEIIDLNTNEETRSSQRVQSAGSNANQIAVARILRAYLYHTMTDRWGYIPYSEALQGEDDFTPSYDSQEAIYQDLLTELSEAVEQIDDGAGPTGDYIFEGDMGRWEAFANTLRMRIALRLSERNPAGIDYVQHFTDAYNAGPIEQDVMYPYLADANNENPWFNRFRTRTDYAISNTLSDTMKAVDDQRLLVYADPAPNYNDEDGQIEFSDINPMPYGVSADSAGNITNAEVSFPGQAIRDQDAPLPIMTMAELQFMIAEAIERGWIAGDAAQEYYDGIQASWEQWDVYDEGDFTTYILDPDVAYTSADWEQKIGFQKWIALFPQGYEAWAEWRRLGNPELEPAPAAVNNSGEIPVRQGYPGDESELNSENYQQAVEAQNIVTGLDEPVWWDVD